MANDKAIGGAIFAGSVIGIIVYGILMVYEWEITLRMTAFLGVALLFTILGWIGYTMATTPPPEPITEIPDVGQKASETSAKRETTEAKQ